MAWTAKQVYVQRTFNKGRFLTPKTEGLKRQIDLAPALVTALQKWRLACPANELALIFPNDAVTPMNYSNLVSRDFRPALRAASCLQYDFTICGIFLPAFLLNRGRISNIFRPSWVIPALQ